MKRVWLVLSVLTFIVMGAPLSAQFRRTRFVKPPGPDIEQFRASWRVLEPITRRNLSIYPVVSNLKVDISRFITLDEGLALGSVKIGERGELLSAFYRRRERQMSPRRPRDWDDEGASVNELVLVNDSSRPLLLLAGEVVSGGKQNRIIGADLVVPPKSEPLPLTVFCVEHGRWTAGGGAFDSANAMAHPTIRREAAVSKSQAGVWGSVAQTVEVTAAAAPTSSYLDVLNSPQVKRHLEEEAKSIEADYERELREQIRDRGAVGVVVAINGALVWSDMFPSSDLFSKYWPKLLRSYVMEAESHGWMGKNVRASVADAQTFLLQARGRTSIKIEPGAYRRTEVSAPDYDIVALEALGTFEDSGLLVHYNKMSRD